MRVLAAFGAAALVVAGGVALHAADIESGVEVGGKISAYRTTKCGGVEDGVKRGKSLCYT